MVHLRRSLINRTCAGALFQPFLSLVLILLIIALAASNGSKLPLGIATIVVFLLWLPGVLAQAEADEHGVRWRYYLPHDIPWTDLQRVTLRVQSFGLQGARHLVVLHTERGKHHLTPACGSRSKPIAEFCRAVVDGARTRGIQVDGTEGWDWVLQR